MHKVIDRLKILVFGAFLVASAISVAVNFIWLAPGKACEQAGNWWDWRTRTCAHPILISDITGRVISDEASHKASKAARAAPQTPAIPAQK